MSKESVDKELQEEVKEDIASETAEQTVDFEKTVSDKEEDSKNEETTSEETENKESSEDKKAKKKIFGKKDKKDQQIEDLEDKYQRLFAEFQNYRNRSEKEKSAMFEVGAKAIIEKILPVVDNLERGVAALSEEDLSSPVGQGMSLIYKQMTTALEEIGVTAIETEGKEFDPELHNAVMHEDNEELGENMISQEFQKGYKYRETVIRHSMVKVAN